MNRWRPRGAAALLALCAVAAAETAAALDLETVLHDVAARNPTLASRYEMAAAARERVAPAGAWTSPMLEVGVQNVPTTGKLDQDMMTMKVVALRQRVPLWGANGLSRKSADNAAIAASARTLDVRNAALGEAVAAYVAAYAAGARARAAARHLDEMRRMVESAEARFAAGTTRLDEALRARSEEARVRAEVAMFREEERGARLALSALRGLAPEVEEEPLAPPPAVEVVEDPAVWLAAVDENHPRLQAADAEVARFEEAGRASRRMAWPDLEVMAEYGFRETLEDGMDQDDMWSARVGLMLPLFSGSREQREGAEMEAMARAAVHERRGTGLELLQQVALAHAAARAAEVRARLLADTVVVTQRSALDAAWGAYAAGSIDLTRVLDAAHALYADEIELTRAREALSTAQARGLALTGHGALAGVTLPGPEVRP